MALASDQTRLTTATQAFLRIATSGERAGRALTARSARVLENTMIDTGNARSEGVEKHRITDSVREHRDACCVETAESVRR